MEMLEGQVGCQQSNSMQLIREDLVQKISKPHQIGIVSKLPNDSTSISSLGTTGEDVNVEQNCVPVGLVRIVWLQSQETNENVTDLHVLDRSFMLGDVVALCANSIGQTGIVVEINMNVDLELPLSGKVVEGIDSRRLRRVRTYMPGDFVVHRTWLGRIEKVMDNVTVMFEGGAKCKIFQADTKRLIPIQSGLTDDTNSPYYPGQRVRGATPGVFKSAKWLKGTWKATRTEGSIGTVDVGSVLVCWITSAITSLGTQTSTAPAMLQKPCALLPLMYASHTDWQLGDWPLLPHGFDIIEHNLAVGDERIQLEHEFLDHKPVGHSSPIDSKKDQESSTSFLDKEVIVGTLNIYKEKQNKQQKKALKKERRATLKSERGADYAALILKTKTKVDVLWQDGTKSYGIEASSLIPIECLGEHEFWPEQYVLDRDLDGEAIDHLKSRIGVMKSVDAKQRTGVVRWLQQKETLESPPQFVSEEVISVYEVVEHPHFNFCLGDVVMRLITNQPKGDVFKATPYIKEEVEQVVISDDQPNIASGEDPKFYKKEKWQIQRRGRDRGSNYCKQSIIDLSWIGNVTELKDGQIQVLWADGSITKVGPQDIFLINNEDEEFMLNPDEVEVMYNNDVLTWTQLEYNEEIEAHSNQMSLALVLDQSESSKDVIQLENDDSIQKCTNCNDCNIKTITNEEKIIPIQNIKTIFNIDLSKCSPRQYKAPLAAAYKKFVSRMVGVLRNMKPLSNSLVFAQGAPHFCCSDLHDVLDTYHIPQRSNLPTSSPSINVKENLNNIFLNSRIEDTEMCSNCSIETKDTSKILNNDTTCFLKSSLRQLQNDPKVTGLYPLLSTDSRHHTMCNMEPPSYEEQFNKEIQQLPQHFKQFDSIFGVADHHFVNAPAPNPQKKWIKKIQTEWTILKENLPSSIYVRVYEDRMDLIRVVIVGAQGTPYHDCLFLFDFQLTQEFPLVPPVAYYHSGGLRLNPNLYENGNVCLSLLNTWKGTDTECWNGSNSSIFQLLISLQGLVLNVAPYFNEAGYERQIGLPEGEKNSLMYNENAFLLSCKSILYLLRKPPQHFEPLIWQHFKQRGPMLLKACTAYMNGALVGSLDENLQPKPSSSESTENCTVGFRIMLGKLLVQLTTEFAKLGDQSNLPSLRSAPHSIIAANT